MIVVVFIPQDMTEPQVLYVGRSRKKAEKIAKDAESDRPDCNDYAYIIKYRKEVK